jgi:hypothetical protein
MLYTYKQNSKSEFTIRTLNSDTTNSQGQAFFSILFTDILQDPKIVPHTYEMLNKYLLNNKWMTQ